MNRCSRIKPTLRCVAVLAALAVPLDSVRSLALKGTIQQPVDAVPPGHSLSVLMSEEWLPEPFQQTYFKSPAFGTPAKGCASVIRLEVEPAGVALRKPLTVTFGCTETDAATAPYAFLNNRWTRVPFAYNENGEPVMSVSDLATYALLRVDVI